MKMKSYRYLGDNIEILGQRLDGARKALANSKSDWAKGYWTGVIECLVAQWHLLPVLHDCDGIFTDRPRWTVKYDFIEGDLGERGGWISNLYQRDLNFNWSWENARAQRLARSQ
jgi:hypothetical protein